MCPDKKTKAKRAKKAVRKSAKRALKESVNLLNFIRAITEKKYNQADKYLSAEIDARLKRKISQAL